MRASDILFARKWRLSKTVERAKKDFERDEDGSLIIFSLFILVLILFIAGMAVDMMRYETRRVALQNTLDGAILAASSLTQDENAETIVKDWVAKAGFDPSDVQVKSVDSKVNETTLVGRTVEVTSTASVDTMFMNMLGVGSLNGPTGGMAAEAVQNVEISLVLDISGSMGWNGKMAALKEAAKEFVDVVFESNPRSDTVTISVVPYNAVVVTGADLLSRLNAAPNPVVIPSEDLTGRAGELTEYADEHTYSTCVVFEDEDFKSRAIGPSTDLTRVSHFRRNGGENDASEPSMSRRWCNEERTNILVHSSNAKDIKDHIDGLTAAGWTAIDVGMKWGTALLDPALEPAVTDMVNVGLLDETARGRPGQYDETKTMKIVVVMTDGANTVQRDLKKGLKKGPSRIWHSEKFEDGNGVLPDGSTAAAFDGYLVEMPDNDASKRWYLPGLPGDNEDKFFGEEILDGVDDERQLDYIELYKNHSVPYVANHFFKDSGDATAYVAFDDAQYVTEDGPSADLRLKDICSAAKAGGDIRVYAIGFEAPAAGLAAMSDCASLEGDFFSVGTKEIGDAFRAIAGQITALRLMQ